MGCSKKEPDCMDVHSTAEISAHFFCSVAKSTYNAISEPNSIFQPLV